MDYERLYSLLVPTDDHAQNARMMHEGVMFKAHPLLWTTPFPFLTEYARHDEQSGPRSLNQRVSLTLKARSAHSFWQSHA
jgi:hypothetical protein